MDLAAFFDETAADIAPRKGGPVSEFPISKKTVGNGQMSENKSISHVSRFSQAQTGAPVAVNKKPSQAGAGARARGGNVRPWETRETWEMLAGSEPYISHLPSHKWEIKRESGKSAGLPATIAPSSTAFDERAAFLEYECGLPRAEAEAQARLETRAATQDDLILWRTALGGLSPDRAPCPGYRLSEWPTTLARALAFLDTFGEQAVALGWTAPRLFGVHPEAGIVRVDACGALVLPIGGPVHAITADTVGFGHLTHRAKPGQLEGVPIWAFAASNDRACLCNASTGRQCLGTGAEEACAMASSVSRDPCGSTANGSCIDEAVL